MMELEEARCLLCYGQLHPGDQYIMVRMADPADGRLVTPENRSGVIHLSHLSNIFNPDKIAVQVFATTQYGPNNGHDVRVKVEL